MPRCLSRKKVVAKKVVALPRARPTHTQAVFCLRTPPTHASPLASELFCNHIFSARFSSNKSAEICFSAGFLLPIHAGAWYLRLAYPTVLWLPLLIGGVADLIIAQKRRWETSIFQSRCFKGGLQNDFANCVQKMWFSAFISANNRSYIVLDRNFDELKFLLWSKWREDFVPGAIRFCLAFV